MPAENPATSISLQLPLTLHRKSERVARDAGVSLHSLILVALAERLREFRHKRAARKTHKREYSGR